LPECRGPQFFGKLSSDGEMDIGLYVRPFKVSAKKVYNFGS
jgi:hypothetical protein